MRRCASRLDRVFSFSAPWQVRVALTGSGPRVSRTHAVVQQDHTSCSPPVLASWPFHPSPPPTCVCLTANTMLCLSSPNPCLKNTYICAYLSFPRRRLRPLFCFPFFFCSFPCSVVVAMLRRSTAVLDSFKEHYHRVHLPRRLALQRYMRQEHAKLQRQSAAAAGGAATSSTTRHSESTKPGEVPYSYNRWWVTNDHEFLHQFAFVEDPDVTREKRQTLPVVTKENIWREPQKTYFMPFAPYIKVVDYAKDPDSKFVKPVNVPRWKDYMQRTKPVVPRTWY